MWNIRIRDEPPPPDPAMTCDVYITCYNEPVELVRETAEAARDIDWHHKTYILDDGNSAAMRAMAEEIGVDYITRSTAWVGKDRHAKAGNLVNAMSRTTGEFLLILDADQIPHPAILRRTLGYFRDAQVSFVQTPQWFFNTPPGDPFGTDADLFYGPIQQGKDGLNSAFFCGSNAVLRREALMSIGIRWYVRDQERSIRESVRLADRLLRKAQADLQEVDQARAVHALDELRAGVAEANARLKRREPIQDITWDFQRKAQNVSRLLVQADLDAIEAELNEIPGLEEFSLGEEPLTVLAREDTLELLAGRNMTPLTAMAAVRTLLLGVDLDRDQEAEPVLPIATISVTEDMATAMRMHATGWKSVYHHEVLGFVVTPKERQGGVYFRLVRPQLAIMGITALAIVVGLGRLALGMIDEPVPILVNVFWGCYNLVMLSVVVEAATYQPPDDSPATEVELGGAQGRIAGAAVRF